MTEAPDVPAASDSPFGLRGVVNLRDWGGQRTADGARIRTGLLYRSGQLDGQDPDALGHLGLRAVFDLRGHDELDVAPDRVPDGVEVVHLDVLAGSRERIATELTELLTQPELVEETMRSGLVEDHYRSTYRNLVLLDSARAAYAELFTRLSQLDGPALFHCTAGKDRTGWAAAALLTLLGVDDDAVTQDYLLSSAPVLASFRSVLDSFADAGGDPALLVPVFAVTTEYLQAARDALDEEFGTIEAYFTDGLGLDVEVHEHLRRRFVDAPR